MKKFFINSVDPSGKEIKYSFSAKDFKSGLQTILEMFGAVNLKSHDPINCKDPIRSWEFVKEGLLWFVEAGPAPKK